MTPSTDSDVLLKPQTAELPHAMPGPVTAPFWDGCKQSVLLYQRCGRCRAPAFPPAEHCRECLARDQRWERSAGTGSLYSWTVVHRPVTPAFATPYAPAIVTLAEGYQMVTNIINTTPRQLRLDLPVRVTFVKVGGGLVLPYFEPSLGPFHDTAGEPRLKGPDMGKDDLILISVDDHIAEPADMFDAHVPQKYKDQAPRVVMEADGTQQWYYGSIRGRNLGLNSVAGKPREMYNIDATAYDEMRPGCFNVDERVRDMNAGGQLAGLNFPNWTGFSGQVLNQGPDRDVNLAMIKAYNDWHIDEWCGAYPGRFIPCGILPLWDADEAASEIRRLAGKGCHAVTFSENPQALNMPSIHTDYWYPLFTAACDTKTVLCTHIGSSSRSAQFSSDAPASVAMTGSSLMSAYTLLELIWARFWKDFPELKFSLTEGDIGWIPYFLWRSEHVFNRHSGWTKHEFPPGYDGPGDVFRRHIYTCFISDKVGPQLLDGWFNEDTVCWESDYPHSDTNWPFAPEDVIETMGALDDATINKITHENAMRAYSFDPFAHIPKDQARAGALRSQASDVDVVTHVGHEASQRDLDAWARMTSFSKMANADISSRSA